MFLHIDAVYSLSVNPVNDNVFASSSDDGRVLIWDTRGPPNAGESQKRVAFFIVILNLLLLINLVFFSCSGLLLFHLCCLI